MAALTTSRPVILGKLVYLKRSEKGAQLGALFILRNPPFSDDSVISALFLRVFYIARDTLTKIYSFKTKPACCRDATLVHKVP